MRPGDASEIIGLTAAEGGRVTMPLENTFWGARFGTLVDRYGVNWMFNAELPT
jgi:PhnB protein